MACPGCPWETSDCLEVKESHGGRNDERPEELWSPASGGQGFVFALSCNPTKTKNTFRAGLLVKLFTLKGLHLVEVKPPPTERPRPTLEV